MVIGFKDSRGQGFKWWIEKTIYKRISHSRTASWGIRETFELTLTFHKSLGQNCYALSISGHRGIFWPFSRLHRMFNTLSPLKMAERPSLT